MRDAIIVSGWNWEGCNVPERLALALAYSGRRVLYCDNPISFLRHRARDLIEVEKQVFALGLKFLGHRVNTVTAISKIQTKYLASQIVRTERKLALRRPLFIYPHGEHCLTLCREFKQRGYSLVHICMDYHLQEQMEHVQASDLTLVIPEIAFSELRNTFGVKVQALPQMAWRKTQPAHLKENRALSAIPRPRLGYLGDLSGRVSIELVRAVLRRHPEWQFISFGTKNPGALINEHVLPWRTQPELRAIIPELDIGFMPYDCADPKNFHCVPLKCFDYFDEGIPVVSTPISYLRQYADIVYLGGSPEELESAISHALAEPTDSAQRAKRRFIAQQHSIETVSHLIEGLIEQHIR